MAYRNGTYVAFHADGTTNPIASDIKYYTLMKAWDAREDIDFVFANSHDKTPAVRDSSRPETLERRIKERLNNSKNFVLIITGITKNDIDWVPFEIEYAIDRCCLPVIAIYPDYRVILGPNLLSSLWPLSLATRIRNNRVKAIHLPFAKYPLNYSIRKFSVNDEMPNTALDYYSADAHRTWNLLQANEQEQNYRKLVSLSWQSNW